METEQKQGKQQRSSVAFCTAMNPTIHKDMNTVSFLWLLFVLIYGFVYVMEYKCMIVDSMVMDFRRLIGKYQ